MKEGKLFLRWMLLPILEILFLRHQINLGISFQVSETLIIGGLAFFVFICATKDNFPSRLSFEYKKFLPHIVFLGSFLWASLSRMPLEKIMGEKGFWMVWILLGFCTLISSVFFFSSFQEMVQRIRKFPKETFFCALAVVAMFFYYSVSEQVWNIFARPTTWGVTQILNLSGLKMLPSDPFHLKHETFEVFIAPACSGVEGMAFFLIIFSLILVKDWKGYSAVRTAMIYLSGTILMFFLNLVRIAIFFLVAVYMRQKWGSSESTDFILWAFHSHIGWVLYAAGISVFLALHFYWNKKRVFPQYSH